MRVELVIVLCDVIESQYSVLGHEEPREDTDEDEKKCTDQSENLL